MAKIAVTEVFLFLILLKFFLTILNLKNDLSIFADVTDIIKNNIKWLLRLENLKLKKVVLFIALKTLYSIPLG